MKICVGLATTVLIAGCSSSQPAQNQKRAVSAQIDTIRSPNSVIATDPALARITVRVMKEGTQNFLKRVSDSDADWRHFLDKVSAGDETALSLAAQLRPKADAGTAEALDTAAAQGLPHAPLAVLELVHVGATVDSLCTSPFIEPESGVEKKYNIAAREALDRVPVAERQEPTFDQCRDALAQIAAKL